MLTVYADESKQGSFLFGVACATSDMTSVLRKDLRSLVLPGQRSLHFAAESPARRGVLLDQILSFDLSIALIDTQESNQSLGREKGLRNLVRFAEEIGATKIVLEMDESTLKVDQAILRGFVRSEGETLRQFQILPRHAEPLLWVPDAIAWSYQRGGEYRRALLRNGLQVLRDL
jgi:hypothetical protein